MNALTSQMSKLEVNQYKQLQHGLKDALGNMETYPRVNATKYKPDSYYQTVFSQNGEKGKKSRKSRKVSRKNRKTRKNPRK